MTHRQSGFCLSRTLYLKKKYDEKYIVQPTFKIYFLFFLIMQFCFIIQTYANVSTRYRALLVVLNFSCVNTKGVSLYSRLGGIMQSKKQIVSNYYVVYVKSGSFSVHAYNLYIKIKYIHTKCRRNFITTSCIDRIDVCS